MEMLPDGQLVMAARTGSPNPLFMARSSDRGLTWRPYRQPIAWSVYPRLLRLANGVVLLASGRPGVGLWVSADGHGDEWRFHNIAKQHNAMMSGNKLFADDALLYSAPFAAVSNWSFCGWASAGLDCNRTECLADNIIEGGQSNTRQRQHHLLETTPPHRTRPQPQPPPRARRREGDAPRANRRRRRGLPGSPARARRHPAGWRSGWPRRTSRPGSVRAHPPHAARLRPGTPRSPNCSWAARTPLRPHIVLV